MGNIKAKDRTGATINGFYIKDTKREGKHTLLRIFNLSCLPKRQMAPH